MNVKELKRFVADIPEMFDEDEVWSDHPEMQIQWGPIGGLDYPCITDRMERILMIRTQYPEWMTEDILRNNRFNRNHLERILATIENYDHFDGESFRMQQGDWVRREDVIKLFLGKKDPEEQPEEKDELVFAHYEAFDMAREHVDKEMEGFRERMANKSDKEGETDEQRNAEDGRRLLAKLSPRPETP